MHFIIYNSFSPLVTLIQHRHMIFKRCYSSRMNIANCDHFFGKLSSKSFISLSSLTRACSFPCNICSCSCLNCSKFLSSFWCQGYNTKTWKQRADVAIAKLVIENLRAMTMLKANRVAHYCFCSDNGRNNLHKAFLLWSKLHILWKV